MRFRFTLSHETLGSLVISEPDGWKDAVLKLERDKNFHSLVEYFEGSFIFYGGDGYINGGIDFIREVEREYGFDADLSITIEVSFDEYTFDTVFEGLLKLEAIQETDDNKIQVPIIRNDFWAKFINRLDTPVNLQDPVDLDGNSVDVISPVQIELLSQKIQKTSIYDGSLSDPSNSVSMTTPEIDFSGASDGIYNFYSQVGLDLVQNEINESFTYPLSMEDNESAMFELIALSDESGAMRIEFDADIATSFFGAVLETSAESDPSKLTQITAFVNVSVHKNGVLQTIIASGSDNWLGPFAEPIVGFPPEVYTHIFNFSLSGTYDIDCEQGDLIAVYATYGLTFLIDVGTDIGNREWITRGYRVFGMSSVVNFTIQSLFTNTTEESFLLHDAGSAILDRTIGRGDSFYSEFLGSDLTKARQYNSAGCGWLNILIRGLQLRTYSLIEKPFFQSFKQWWEGADPILNLGLGYEEINGTEVIRVEEKEHFYDPEVSLYIDNVRDISRAYDAERIFKTVKIGYKQWQSENISGIDDPQTKHTYASRLKKSGTELTIESGFIAASLAIETTRRTTREKSADYKFDNEIFIIAINPIPVDVSPETSPEITTFAPELDENFDNIDSLQNEETRYNLRLTPARNFMRWIRYLSGGLQSYLSSVFKFTSGEGNFDMVSDMSNTSDGCDEFKGELSEKQDIPVYNDPLHLSLLYEILIPLEWEEYKTIRDNRKKAIAISQTTANHVLFFIKELNYEITKSQARILAWPKELLDIEVIETNPPLIECVPRIELELTVDNTFITVDSSLITVDQTEYTI